MTQNKSFPVLYPDAAGIDISSKEHYVAVRPDADPKPIRAFGAFTEDLISIAQFLTSCGVTTVAMEATGIYWVSLFTVLEEAGFEVILVNARHVKNVRGKKTDVSDAEWIRQLHSCGLLSASFQPDQFTRTLRSYMRHRKNLVEMAATHIRMIQKGFEQMNIKLHHVITDITGKSGQAIIQAIISGEHDSKTLAGLVDHRVKATKEEIIKSLEGTWKPEHIFEIRQSYETFLFYKEKMTECDKEIEKHLKTKAADQPTAGPKKKIKKDYSSNHFNFDGTTLLKQITNVDLIEIFGINENTAVEIISEIGLDMSKWPTEKHFTSWLNLAPNNKISGGKVLAKRITKRKIKRGKHLRPQPMLFNEASIGYRHFSKE